jgi:DNA repair ATPase RecN
VLQSDVVQTFTSFRTVLDSNVASLQRKLDEECVRRHEEDQKLMEANTALSAETTRHGASVQTKVDLICGADFDAWKRELLNCLKDAVESVADCRNRLKAFNACLDEQQRAVVHTGDEFSRELGDIRREADALGRRVEQLTGVKQQDLVEGIQVFESAQADPALLARVAALEERCRELAEDELDQCITDLERSCGDRPLPDIIAGIVEDVHSHDARITALEKCVDSALAQSRYRLSPPPINLDEGEEEDDN